MGKKPHYNDPRREVIVSITLADVVGKLEEEGIKTSSLTEEEIEQFADNIFTNIWEYFNTDLEVY